MRRKRALDPREVLDREHGMRHAEAAEQPANQIPRRIVSLDEAEDVVALLGEREECLRDRADARGGRQAFLPSLQLREQQLELARGGIGGARIEEAGPLTAQIPLGLLEGVEFELDALIDRGHDRAIVGGELDRRRMIDSGGFLHGRVRVNRSAPGWAANLHEMCSRAASPARRAAASSSVSSRLAMQSRTTESRGGAA